MYGKFSGDGKMLDSIVFGVLFVYNFIIILCCFLFRLFMIKINFIKFYFNDINYYFIIRMY